MCQEETNSAGALCACSPCRMLRQDTVFRADSASATGVGEPQHLPRLRDDPVACYSKPLPAAAM